MILGSVPGPKTMGLSSDSWSEFFLIIPITWMLGGLSKSA